MDNATRIQSLKGRVQEANNKRIGAEKALELLKANKDAKLAELANLGITDVSELQTKIAETETNIGEQLAFMESQMNAIETTLLGVGNASSQ